MAPAKTVKPPTRKKTGTLSTDRDDLTPLLESVAKYKALVNNSLTGILIITAAEIRFANKTFEEITGYGPDDVARMAPWDMVHPSQRETVREMGLARLRSGAAKDYYETLWVRKDGTPIWVEVRAAAASDRGEPAVLANVVDISERKQAQLKLHRRIDIEALITAVSTTFINLAASEIDAGLTHVLGRIGRFRGVEMAFLAHVDVNGDWSVTHGWTEEGESFPAGLMLTRRPWLLDALRQNQVVAFADPVDLPAEAFREREAFAAAGIKSLAAVPISPGGRPEGFLGFCRLKEHQDWTDEDLTTFGMAGQVFINALEKKRSEEALRRREEELAFQARNLEEANIALKVLLKRREEDQLEMEEKVLTNVKELAAPFIAQLRETSLDSRQKAYLDVIESTLNHITSPFSRSLSAQFSKLTPKEIQIANLIKLGKTSKEIAGMIGVTAAAVDFHRNNIRQKLSLNKKKANLRSFLLGLK
ncbi:MAG: PAS domain S-box protein [Pseudomonadota bacterium]